MVSFLVMLRRLDDPIVQADALTDAGLCMCIDAIDHDAAARAALVKWMPPASDFIVYVQARGERGYRGFQFRSETEAASRRARTVAGPCPVCHFAGVNAWGRCCMCGRHYADISPN